MSIVHRNRELVVDASGKETITYLRVTKVHSRLGGFSITFPEHLASAAVAVAAAHGIDYRTAGGLKGQVVAATSEKAELDWKILMYWCKQYILKGEAGSRSHNEALDVEGLAAYLKVKPSWVYGQSKRLPHFKAGKHLRFLPHEVVAYLREQSAAGTQMVG